MRSTAEPSGDPGLASARTALAWQRMALSFTSIAAVNLAAAAHRARPVADRAIVVLFAVAAATLALRAPPDRRPALTTARRPIALLAYATRRRRRRRGRPTRRCRWSGPGGEPGRREPGRSGAAVLVLRRLLRVLGAGVAGFGRLAHDALARSRSGRRPLASVITSTLVEQAPCRCRRRR
jgi:hypothetical protein